MTKRLILAAIPTALMIAACTTTPEAPDAADEASLDEETVAAPEEVVAEIEPFELPPTPRERARNAIQFLDAGKEAEAMVEIEAMLAARPSHPTALKLRKQITTDPVELLGDAHSPYEVESGETLSTLADRFLGDPLMFYALSRYNDLAAPNRLMAGQTLKMPESMTSEEREIEVASVEETPRAAEPQAVLPTSSNDVARANKLRLQALEEMNAGDTAGAVRLLRRAYSLDQTNPNIAEDLAKAERIQAALASSD